MYFLKYMYTCTNKPTVESYKIIRANFVDDMFLQAHWNVKTLLNKDCIFYILRM